MLLMPKMAAANPLWGAPRIHGELLKLGIDVAERTVSRTTPQVLSKIAAMPEPDRAMAKRLHAIIKASAPALSPKTWYGMPAYAKDGSVVCFFQSAQKFRTRYATFGFSDKANLDEGAMWPTAFALTQLTAADEARIGALVKKVS
jgi:uncharacterized protein YdhG (YjbR/CyaY superfamily)